MTHYAQPHATAPAPAPATATAPAPAHPYPHPPAQAQVRPSTRQEAQEPQQPHVPKQPQQPQRPQRQDVQKQDAGQQGGQQQALALQWRPRGVDPIPQHRVPSLPDDTQRWIARIAAAVVEVSNGDRPARQMFRVLSPATLERLQRRARVRPGRNGPVRSVTSLRLAQPVSGVIEATAVIQGARRFQAVALELRRRRGQWVVTAAEVR